MLKMRYVFVLLTAATVLGYAGTFFFGVQLSLHHSVYCGSFSSRLRPPYAFSALLRPGWKDRIYVVSEGHPEMLDRLFIAIAPPVVWSAMDWDVLLWPVIAMQIACLWWMLRRKRRVDAEGCAHCGYSLRGNVSGVCPRVLHTRSIGHDTGRCSRRVDGRRRPRTVTSVSAGRRAGTLREGNPASAPDHVSPTPFAPPPYGPVGASHAFACSTNSGG